MPVVFRNLAAVIGDYDRTYCVGVGKGLPSFAWIAVGHGLAVAGDLQGVACAVADHDHRLTRSSPPLVDGDAGHEVLAIGRDRQRF